VEHGGERLVVERETNSAAAKLADSLWGGQI
jgi:hypothetical protein